MVPDKYPWYNYTYTYNKIISELRDVLSASLKRHYNKMIQLTDACLEPFLLDGLTIFR